MSCEVVSVIRPHGLEFREAVLPHYRSDTALVFFHGMSHQANFFDECLKSLALNDGIRGIAVSLEGHGASKLKPEHSINDLRIADYKANILTALTDCARESKAVVPVCHSLSGRCLNELLREGLLPDNVKGAVFLAPVPPGGVIASAGMGLLGDFVRSGRPTPLSFAHALLVTRDIAGFVQSSPDRVLSIFFSSERGAPSRLLNVDAATFCRDYLGPESSRAVWEVLLPSKVSPARINAPVLILGSENDRIIPVSGLRRMASQMKNPAATSLTLYEQVSHEMPMDVDLEVVLGDLRSWLKNR